MESKQSNVICWKCSAGASWQVHCPACGALQRCPGDIDYFTLFSLPLNPSVDLASLQPRYYELSRELHPDRYQNGTAEERAASLANTATLNRAYRTLKDPVLRGNYWLELHGERLGEDNNRVPATLAARVFEVQEQLDELRTAPEDQELRRSIEALGRQIRAEIAGYGERLDSQFRRFRESADRSAGLLAELKQILSERAYLNTLLRDVEKELEDPWNGSSAST